MTQEPKAGRRIVSKGTYTKRAAVKYTLCSFGALSCIYMFYCLANLFRLWNFRPNDTPVAASIAAFCAIILLIVGLGYLIFITINTTRNIDIGVPITRANTSDLSAPDSLVRASAKPVMVQATVLLRAIAEAQGQEVHEEQLLRAAIE